MLWVGILVKCKEKAAIATNMIIFYHFSHQKTHFFDLYTKYYYECKKATHSLLDSEVKAVLVHTSKILEQFSPAAISVEVARVVTT